MIFVVLTALLYAAIGVSLVFLLVVGPAAVLLWWFVPNDDKEILGECLRTFFNLYVSYLWEILLMWASFGELMEIQNILFFKAMNHLIPVIF